MHSYQKTKCDPFLLPPLPALSSDMQGFAYLNQIKAGRKSGSFLPRTCRWTALEHVGNWVLQRARVQGLGGVLESHRCACVYFPPRKETSLKAAFMLYYLTPLPVSWGRADTNCVYTQLFRWNAVTLEAPVSKGGGRWEANTTCINGRHLHGWAKVKNVIEKQTIFKHISFTQMLRKKWWYEKSLFLLNFSGRL